MDQFSHSKKESLYLQSKMLRVFSFFMVLVLLVGLKVGANERGDNCHTTHQHHAGIGGVIDESSRVGKEQKIAMEIAAEDFHRSTCSRQLVLHMRHSFGRAASTAIDLKDSKQVQAIIGTLTFSEAALVSEIDKTTKDIPIISLTSPALIPPHTPSQSPYLIQMGNDITLHTQCIAAIVGHFRWRKVTAIYEHSNGFSTDSGLITLLTDSLRVVNSEIEHHSAFPTLSSLSDPNATIEEELKKLKRKNNRVFIIAQSSLELATVLFERAKQLGMMEKGYVWIVSDEIASLLDSVEDSVISNMQGVIGFKTIFVDTSESFKQFKLKFRRKYGSEYPEEEENSKPSVFALRAYDTTWAVGQATAKSLKNPTSKKLLEEFLSSDFEGLSGRISFKNGKLSNVAKIRIINVVGKMYNEIAYWSPEFGLSENNRLLDSGATERSGNGNGSAGELGPVYWPGGLQTVPPGWTRGNEEKPLKIGVPARGAFNQFVRVSHDPEMNRTGVTGFSVDVFEAAVKRLPYYLPYVLVPFYGSYDDMVEQVYQKSLDAAVGDTEIISERYRYAEFSQPYVESGLVMVVPQKPEKYKTPWLALETFKKEMWLIMAAMHMFIGFVIWFIERGDNPDFEGFGAMLWFAVTLIFFIQREQVKTNLARFVLAPWLFVLLIVTTSFTATLTSMMTVSRLQPSVVDIELLKRTNAAVGCNGNSFIVSYLTNVLHFKPENIKKIDSISEYPDSFKRGNIKAGFFVVPHAKVFLSKYCNGYTMAGPTYKLGGFGFVFPKGSALAVDISEAILKVTESGEMQQLEKHMLSSFNCSSSTSIIDDGPPLGPEPFSGLFYISGGISTVAFLITVARLLGRHWHISRWIQATLINRQIWRLAILFPTQSSMNPGLENAIDF